MMMEDDDDDDDDDEAAGPVVHVDGLSFLGPDGRGGGENGPEETVLVFEDDSDWSDDEVGR